MKLNQSRADDLWTGRVFCFVDPDDALTRLGLLSEGSIPRLILVDMFFGVAERGPEIIRHIRGRSAHCAIVGYSAQSTSSSLVPTGTVFDGAAASEVGADEWFDKAALLDDDFFLDPVRFLACIVRALERRQCYVRQLESTVERLQEAVASWLANVERNGDLTGPVRAALISEFVALFDPWVPGSHWPRRELRQRPGASLIREVGVNAIAERSSPRSLDPDQMIFLGATGSIMVRTAAELPEILAATTDEATRASAIETISALLTKAADRVGETALADYLRKSIADLGKQGAQETVRALSFLARPWCDARRQGVGAQSDVASTLLGLSTFLVAAQGQAAAELGLVFEAETYLSVAASDAARYDIPFVRRFAQQGLMLLGKPRAITATVAGDR